MLFDDAHKQGCLSVEPIELDCPPAALIDALGECDQPVLLDSAGLHDDFGRYSVLTCCPLEVLTVHDGKLIDQSGRTLGETDESIWLAMHAALGGFSVRNTQAAPYVPGWFGYLGYELGRHVERLPASTRRDVDLPDLRLGFYDAVLVYDAAHRNWSLVELQFDSPPAGAGQAGQALRKLAARPQYEAACDHPAAVELADASPHPADSPMCDFTPDEYRQAVAKCVDYIAAGDIFQVNLTQRFTVPEAPAPLAIYHALRRRSPAWHAAYLGFEFAGKPAAILSSSPELFMRVRDGRVTTRPIKGTRPRIGIAEDDQAAAAELLASAKDNAELAMIVDLLRNDIGRVCTFGSVRVSEPRKLETHPTVYHLVATVEGELRAGVGPAELIRATFPGGSITGAPKIRAMEIIDELEPVTRGVYTGCIGTIGVDGNSEWNIAIRTIIHHGGQAYVHAGGGIVADSQPDLEYQETLHKARAMLEAVAEARQAIEAATADGEP